MALADVDTPALIVDLETLERNIERMSALARDAGVKVRPHTKTHKTPHLAHLQVRAGARGITVAKLGEAEVMADAGLDDILIANEIVGAAKIDRLAALAERVRVRTCVDSLAGGRMLSEGADRNEVRFEVLLDVNTGLDRTGVLPDDALSLATELARLPGIDIAGVFSYAGYKPGIPDETERRTWAEREARTAVAVAQELRAVGIAAEDVSVAGSSSAPFAMQVPGVTEVRPGQYVFNDMNMCRMGMCELGDCALTVRARVISRPAPDRAVLDSGSKILTTERRIIEGEDPGFGTIRGMPEARIVALWEEHAVVQSSRSVDRLQVGDIVDVIPNHVCPTVNLVDRWHGVRHGSVEGEFRVAARGKIA